MMAREMGGGPGCGSWEPGEEGRGNSGGGDQGLGGNSGGWGPGDGWTGSLKIDSLTM